MDFVLIPPILDCQRTEGFILFVSPHAVVQHHFRVCHRLWTATFTVVLMSSTFRQVRWLITFVDFIDTVNVFSGFILILFELFIRLIELNSFVRLCYWHVLIWCMNSNLNLIISLISDVFLWNSILILLRQCMTRSWG